MSLPQTVEWLGDKVRLIDQRELPERLAYMDLASAAEVADAIKTLAVRGAPAIGVAAAYGAALAVINGASDVRAELDALASARPTAVNLRAAVDEMRRVIDAHDGAPREAAARAAADRAIEIHKDDIASCKAIGENGAALLPREATVMTHCNAGALATGGQGTALGVIRSARDTGHVLKIYSCETRPVLQGARLTAWELSRDGFDVTLITDGMAGALMSRGGVDAVIVGADRIAANGDTANKIGTYSLAVLARAHGVKFYVAAPMTTVDASIADGSGIPIEERDGGEIRALPGGRRVPDDIPVWNPSFDVTPADLITAIITERGVHRPPFAF